MSTPALKVLAQGYFHQDFRLEEPDSTAVIKQFVEESPQEDITEVIDQVSELLRTSSEQRMRDLWWSELRSGFDPSRHGMTYRQWFEKVLEILRESA